MIMTITIRAVEDSVDSSFIDHGMAHASCEGTASVSCHGRDNSAHHRHEHNNEADENFKGDGGDDEKDPGTGAKNLKFSIETAALIWAVAVFLCWKMTCFLIKRLLI